MNTHSTPKERILETAYRLFYAQGFNMTGINQILDEAGVAKASLYQHFGSKEDLGVEYIKKVRQDWFSAFDAHLAKKDDPKEKILTAFDFLKTNMIIHAFKGCRFLNLLADVDASKRMQIQILEHKAKLRNLFKKLAQQYATDREFLTPNTHDAIYLLFEAAIVECKLYKDTWPIVAAKKTVDSLLSLNA